MNSPGPVIPKANNNNASVNSSTQSAAVFEGDNGVTTVNNPTQGVIPRGNNVVASVNLNNFTPPVAPRANFMSANLGKLKGLPSFAQPKPGVVFCCLICDFFFFFVFF
jgi:hypothetical protein